EDTMPRSPTIASNSRKSSGFNVMARDGSVARAGRSYDRIAGARLSDLPGLSRDEQLGDVPRPPLGDGLLLLLDQDLLVGRLARVGGQHPERDRVVGGPEMRQHERGRAIGLVVHPERALGHVPDLHDLWLDAVEDEAATIVHWTEDQRLAVLDLEFVQDLRLPVVEHVPGEVVVDVAVLQNLDEGGALVLGGALERLLHVGDVAVDGAGDEGRARAEG